MLELDGRPVACHFGFQLNAKLIWYLSGFDVELWHCSPGEVLIRNLLQYAHHAGLREFDFTIGGEMYKSRFANVTRTNFRVYLDRAPYTAAGAYRRSAVWAYSAGRRVTEHLKTKPRLYNKLRKRWLSAVEFRSRQRALYRNAGLVRYARLTLCAVFRGAIFAYDRALVFSFPASMPFSLDRRYDSDAKIEISTCHLSELAILSLEHPHDLPKAKIDIWRTRLLEGQRIYALRSNGQLAHLACAGAHTTLSICEVQDASPLALGNDAMVIEHVWSAREASAARSWASALRLLAQQIGDGREVWTYRHDRDHDICHEMEAAGFQLRHRVVQVRALHRLRWNRIEHCEPVT